MNTLNLASKKRLVKTLIVLLNSENLQPVEREDLLLLIFALLDD
jgi:hypothetical protein